MKKKKADLNQKIFLQKEIVANLSIPQQQGIQGGVGFTLNPPTKISMQQPPNCLCCVTDPTSGL
ncbi:class I lanthipeptide [Chitinophaga sp. RAB17]|uniref:class I lanthipeptide n=1 Tax=Chitinophaga sp. RAB17 TaxID=3233049 RepID=UPI003F8DA24B